MLHVDLTWNDIRDLSHKVARQIDDLVDEHPIFIYGIPNGGIYAAQAVQSAFHRLGNHKEIKLIEDPCNADFYIDDIVDTGNTIRETIKKYGEKIWFSLINKQNEKGTIWEGKWVNFPWERQTNKLGVRENIVRILEYIGEDPQREGLLETPDRIMRSYDELFAGYKQDPKDVMKTFEDGACDEMVLLKGIEFYSHCEHHGLLFQGEANIAYIPNKRIIGVSKLARLLEIYSRRLQVQERLTTQITKALDEHLQPQGSACVLSAKHMCMVCRGIKKQNSIMVTSSLTGEFRKPEVRAEFFNLIKG